MSILDYVLESLRADRKYGRRAAGAGTFRPHLFVSTRQLGFMTKMLLVWLAWDTGFRRAMPYFAEMVACGISYA